MTARTPAKVHKAKHALEQRLGPLAGFVGTGITALPSGEPAILVLVTRADSPARDACAALIGAAQTWRGVPVRTDIVGEPRKLGPT
jgi:hypothetical protein